MTLCRYPGCGVDLSDHRPYARSPVPSATTVAGLLDDGKSRAFAWAATAEAARLAVHEGERWHHLGVDDCRPETKAWCPACRYVRSEHDRLWRAKADLGTHVHHLALSWAQEEAVLEDDTTAPYLDALQDFYATHRPEWAVLERTIVYDRAISSMKYVGSLDFIASIGCPLCSETEEPTRCRWLVDIKTGGFHAEEQTLQLAAYKYATHLTTWKDGKEALELREPMPKVDHAGVLLLRGDGQWRLVELPADGDAHGVFLRLRQTYAWLAAMRAWQRGRPDPWTGEVP